MKGWVLDVGADIENSCMVIWLKGENGSVKKCECAFSPAFYVYSSPADLTVLEQTLEGDPFIKALEYDEKRLWPGESAQKVLKISLSDYRVLMKLAREIDEMGDFSLYELFNVDISIPFAFMLEKNLIPMTFIELTDDCEFKLLEDVDSIDYTVPELSSLELDVEVNARGIPTGDDPLAKLFVNHRAIAGKDEEGMLIHLMEELQTIDPDIIYTTKGDSFLLPYLYYRAELNEFEEFCLGRDRAHMPVGKAKSYFSYGRVIYKPPRFMLNGRIHIDRSNSFLYREGGIHGL